MKFKGLFKACNLVSGISETQTQGKYKDHSSNMRSYWPLLPVNRGYL